MCGSAAPTRPVSITPSILSADFRVLEREVKDAEAAGADRIHCDVMDGMFVPNITFGPLVVEAVKKCVTIPLDVHLMIHEPGRYIDAFCRAGSDVVTVHAEACDDVRGVIDAIRSHGVRAGVCVNPDKPVSLFTQHLDRIDQILIMTVYAGFGGQAFMPDMLAKIREVRDRCVVASCSPDIQVDGGIDNLTAGPCVEHGANVLVAGSYIFASGNYRERIEALRHAAQRGRATGR